MPKKDFTKASTSPMTVSSNKWSKRNVKLYSETYNLSSNLNNATKTLPSNKTQCLSSRLMIIIN